MGKQTFLTGAGRLSGAVQNIVTEELKGVSFPVSLSSILALPSANYVTMKITFLKFSFIICKIKLRIGPTT